MVGPSLDETVLPVFEDRDGVGVEVDRRRLVGVLTGTSMVRPIVAWRVRAIDTLEAGECRSPQLSPATSPRRIPVWATRCNAG